MSKPYSSKTGSRRRSSRILLRVSLLISAVDASGNAEWERVETSMLSFHGGLLRTRQTFGVGAIIEIRMYNKERIAHARVVWKSTEPAPQGAELGFEIIDYPGFWEITFPSEIC